MEATAEDFTKLFQVVYYQMVDNLSRPSTACTPSRKLRRRGSDPLAPKGTTADRMYYIEGEGWVNCVKPDMPTPGSGSGSSQKCSKNHRFLKDMPSSRTGNLSRRVSTASNKRRKAPRVLSHDGLPQPDANDESSSDHNPFGSD